jgi:ParB/RepB/Spo0J family partition protein
MKIHPAASLLPALEGDALKELVESIRTRGQLVPIVVHQGRVIDGRNRLHACSVLGIKPKFVEAKLGDRSPEEYVLDANLERRHLNPSQKAMLALRLIPPGRAPKGSQRITKRAAKAVKASPRSVQRAQAVAKASPKLAEQVVSGGLTLRQAEKQLRRKEQVAQAEAYVPLSGKFGVIAVDFPWKYGDELEGMGRELPYPTMTIEEICAFPIPAADDCALFCWVTNSHLIDPDAFPRVAQSLKERYGFVPKAIRTWVKNVMGLGRYWRNDTEHLVLFTRGNPVFNDVTQLASMNEPRGEHSEKPARAYRDIEAMCVSTYRAELFARKPREGWVTSGSELTPPADLADSAAAGDEGNTNNEAVAGAAAPSFSQPDVPGLSYEKDADGIVHLGHKRKLQIIDVPSEPFRAAQLAPPESFGPMIERGSDRVGLPLDAAERMALDAARDAAPEPTPESLRQPADDEINF